MSNAITVEAANDAGMKYGEGAFNFDDGECDGFAEYRPALRHWLDRMGWNKERHPSAEVVDAFRDSFLAGVVNALRIIHGRTVKD